MKSYLWKSLVVGIAVVMVLSMALSVVPAAMHAAGAAAPATTIAPSTSVKAPAAAPTAFAQQPAAGHTRGTLNVYEVAPQGANTEDPAAAYDTLSYEPILNVYQTLLNYNGSSTDTFVPTLATCIPDTVQCTTDYGTNLTNYTGSHPIEWTFVIDPAAHFYDPSTGTSWKVEPSDVMFSIARTLAFADLPFAGKSAGWIVAQSLLQYGNASWDRYHVPFNNSPAPVLGSMLINSSVYCPSKAMGHASGCVTFIANGEGTDWPYFLQLVADNLGASIVPCGWFTANGAAIPGWAGTKHANGDGPCMLPNGGNSTNGAGWSSYLAGLNPKSWDTYEELAYGWPAIQPGVQWSMVGSGPYYAGVVPGIGYDLRVNPAYAEPSGCSGVGSLATYSGYCDPAPGAYIKNVNVFWEPDDSFGISQYGSGSADFAGIETTHTTTLLQLAAAGDLKYESFPTISTFFTPINLAWSPTEFASQFPSEQTPTVPTNFFTNLAVREFYVHAYPYTTVENTVRTVDGVQYDFNNGGPIPVGMGNYYPSNVSFPTGDPIANPTVVGGAAWWWAQATNASSPYFDPQLASCSSGHPCTWPIAGLQGDPGDDQAIADWISEIETLTGGALQPYGGSSFDLTFDQFLNVAFTSAYDNPLVSETGTGWAPDYPDPTDYIVPEAAPDSTYTAADAFSEQLQYGHATVANNTTCGHNVTSFANLTYWANAAINLNGSLNSTCQGVAYSQAVAWMAIAAGLPVGVNRTLDYNQIEQITNALSMMVWNGQANEVVSAAPWIDLSSVNTNPMIGGGGDNIWFHIQYAYSSTVSFHESGLAAGTSWSVTFGTTTQTSNTATISFAGIANGTYNYSTAFVTGYGAAPANGSITVTGPYTQDVTFTAFSGQDYAVTFDAIGLISNTSWSIVVPDVGTVSTNGLSVAFSLPNGDYNYTPSVIPGYANTPGGPFTVASAALLTNVTYTYSLKAIYAVTFKTSGLPTGQSWSVTLSATDVGAYTISSTTSAITFEEVASSGVGGSYTAVYTAPSGYIAVTSSSVVIVAGPTTTIVPFSPTFSVTFTESGAPTGQDWTVFFAGTSKSAATLTIVFAAPNGTWSFGLVAPSGYTATPAGGQIAVKGAATGVAATFASNAKPAPSSSYLSSLAYELIGALAVLALIGFGLAAYLSFRRPPTSPPPKGWAGEKEAPETPGSTTTVGSEFEPDAENKG